MRGRTLPGEWACGEASECDGVVIEGEPDDGTRSTNTCPTKDGVRDDVYEDKLFGKVCAGVGDGAADGGDAVGGCGVWGGGV